MNDNIKILQIAPRNIFPPDDGGKVGIYNLTKKFIEFGAEVDLIFYVRDKEELKFVQKNNDLCTIHPIIHDTSNTLSRILKSALNSSSIFINKHYTPKAKEKLLKLAKNKEFNIIHVDHTQMMPLGLIASKIFNVPVGLRLHNVEHTFWERYAKELPAWNPKKIYIEKQAELLKNSEANFIKRADINFAITNEDRKRAIEISPESNIKIASAGVDTNFFTPDPKINRDPYELVLATMYSYGQNLSAVMWLIEKVMPIVKAKEPKAKLTLIGKGAPDNLNLYSKYGVELLGYVDSVKPYLNRASIYVAPLFTGGGIRIKILEAMAMELPVIATSVSAEGIEADKDNGLFIENSPSRTASLILELFRKSEIARKKGINARKFVKNHFTWRKNVGIIYDEYQKLLSVV